MQRLIYILSITFVLSLSLRAQNKSNEKDEEVKSSSSQSYKSFKLRSSESITDILFEAERLKSKEPEKALQKVQEALGLSLTQKDVYNEGKCYVLLGEINESIEEWNLALDNYNRASQKLTGKYVSAKESQRALKGQADMNLKLGNRAQALQQYQQLLNQKITTEEKAGYQLDISEVYYQMGEYNLALNVIDRISYSRKMANPALESRMETQKAKIYAQLNDVSNTRQSFSNSINTMRSGNASQAQQKKDVSQAAEFPEEQIFQDNKEEIAGALRKQGRYDDEIDIRNQSIEYNLESNNLKEVTKDKVEISKVLEVKGETFAAINELEEAARIADTINNPKVQANAYLALADIYEKNGRSQQAILAFKKYSNSVTRLESLSEKQLNEKTNLLKIQKDIEEVSKNISVGQKEETIEEATVKQQRLIIYGLLFIISIVMTTSYFIYKSAQASKVANQLLALKSLRSQMNPHFIFNALNSVNHFIAQQDERTANKFLSEFSQLMRLVLENSQEDFITLQKEQEILSLYLKLEHYRFRDKFDYEIIADEEINTEIICVPPMLIQPYIENAVWHGLRYKESKGKLILRFRKEQNNLVVEITDDGIGRKRSAELKTANQKKHNSTGLKNIEERLSIINKVYKANYRVLINDLVESPGTHVLIYLPMNNNPA